MRDLRRGLPLEGWGERSIWGYDTGMQAFFAQLWRDDGPPEAADEPQYWITPLSDRWPSAIEDPSGLARAIVQATGSTWREVTVAMIESAPDILRREASPTAG
jgi:hypothetical protein